MNEKKTIRNEIISVSKNLFLIFVMILVNLMVTQQTFASNFNHYLSLKNLYSPQQYHHTVLKGHLGSVSFATFSPNGKQVITGSHDKTFRIWDSKNGNLIFSLEGYQARVVSAFYSPQDKQVFTSSADSNIKSWNAQTGEFINDLIQARNNIFNIFFHTFGMSFEKISVFISCSICFFFT